jgi:hypothetical protein
MTKRKFSSVKSTGLLEQKPVVELLEIYRSLASGTPPDFKSKEDLVRAVILKLAAKDRPSRRRNTVAKITEKEPKGRKPWAFDATRLEPTTPRKGTKREGLIAMLRKGATFGEIQLAFGWTYKQAFVQMRAVNTINGYGFTERAKRLTIFTYDEGPPA